MQKLKYVPEGGCEENNNFSNKQHKQRMKGCRDILPLNVLRNLLDLHGSLQDTCATLACDQKLNKTGLTENSSEQRELVFHALVLQEAVNLVGSQGTLQLLAVELLLLNLLDGKVALNAVHGTTEVATTAGRGDQVGHTGTFIGESTVVDGGTEEGISELNHLHQTNTHNGSLGIVTPAHADNPSSGQSNDVLERATDGHTGNIVDDAYVEVRAVEDRLQQSVVNGRVGGGQGLEPDLGDLAGSVLVLELDQVGLGSRGGALGSRCLGVHVWGVVGDASLGPLLKSDLVGDVGTGKGTTVDTEDSTDGLGEKVNTGSVDVDTFDARDTAGVRNDLAFDLLAGLDDELMGEVENEKGAVLDRILQGRVGVQVDGQLDSWEVLDILMDSVNHLSQFLRASI